VAKEKNTGGEGSKGESLQVRRGVEKKGFGEDITQMSYSTRGK